MNSAELNILSVEDSQDYMGRALRALQFRKLATAHGSTFYFALPNRDEK